MKEFTIRFEDSAWEELTQRATNEVRTPAGIISLALGQYYQYGDWLAEGRSLYVSAPHRPGKIYKIEQSF